MEFNENVKIRPEKFGAAIFETLKEKVFVTNESGKEIVGLLQQGRTEEEIVGALAGNYVAEPDKIKADVASFIGKLKETNIIKK